MFYEVKKGVGARRQLVKATFRATLIDLALKVWNGAYIFHL